MAGAAGQEALWNDQAAITMEEKGGEGQDWFTINDALVDDAATATDCIPRVQ